ncbi:hypothetical protein BQ9544_0657 [Escherichia coli O127:H6]|uniref:Uncharacterized protein n=1 Tax=Escherichia coli O127:H6 (strain E2348/69 / EPEC) TaxID=574521 RepID=B7ULQ3_ECO27|nr:predicted protein [Escherichia coli O127:H6 str. E2348/69]SLM05719.1 hypothetical protein BQ9544_0657 [Escherichia coli O127:H6]SNU22450.1 hypothetical protein BQ9550_0657 [Escherichia coli O127:H6]
MRDTNDYSSGEGENNNCSHYSRKSRISINRKVRPASRAKAAKC